VLTIRGEPSVDGRLMPPCCSMLLVQLLLWSGLPTDLSSLLRRLGLAFLSSLMRLPSTMKISRGPSCRRAKGLTAWFMLSFEVFEIVLVMRIIFRLLVLSQFGVVTVFHCLASALVSCLVVGCEYLPSLADRFGNLGKAQVFSFEMLSYFYNARQTCQACVKYSITYD